MTARGYEQDEALRVIKERVRRLELTVARNRPSTGASYDGTASGSAETDVQGAIDDLYAAVAAADIEVDDEGTPLTTALASLNFAGAGVTATTVGDDVTVTIPGGGDVQRTFAFFGG